MLVGSAVEAATLDGDDTVVVLAESPETAFDARPGLRRSAPRTPAARVTRTWARDVLASGRAATFALDPGDGTDVLEVQTTAPLLVGDLATDRVVVSDEQGAVVGTVPATGFEGLAARAFLGMASPEQRFELTGDEADNHLQASTCQVVLHGGAGNDHLRVGDDGEPGLLALLSFLEGGCARTAEVHGDAGDDTLLSRAMGADLRGVMKGDLTAMKEVRVRDLLDGGEGTDSADAGKGIDTCLVEVRVGCER
jgi:Ca2+-binding RTX toxin-like protein